MADPRFFSRAGPFTLSELAGLCEGRLSDETFGTRVIEDVAPLQSAGPNHLAFLDNRKYLSAFAASKAGACIVGPAFGEKAPEGMALIVSDTPYRSYALAASAFYPEPPPVSGTAPTASVDPGAHIGEGCRIDPGVVIGAGAHIGEGCVIGANAVIGPGVVIGEYCRIGANSTLSHCLVGRRVRLSPGVRIGQEGFGFAIAAGVMLSVPQLGRVVIEDDVDIGANVCIDRGAGPDTVIGAGCRIDNLVQIGHNVRLGRGCVLVAQVGVSGSTTMGDYVMAGGQAGITGHLTIGEGARIAAQAGVMRDVKPGAAVVGSPAVSQRDYWRQVTTLSKLAKK